MVCSGSIAGDLMREPKYMAKSEVYGRALIDFSRCHHSLRTNCDTPSFTKVRNTCIEDPLWASSIRLLIKCVILKKN